MEFTSMLNMPLDYWSIVERLNEIEMRPQEYDRSVYYDDYADLFHELSSLAAALSCDLGQMMQKLDFRSELPRKKLSRHDTEDYTEIIWFNTAVSILAETHMSSLLEHEGCYDPEEIESEKAKRRRALLALTKDMMLFLFEEVFNLLMRFVQLNLAYQAISGTIDELEHLHSFRQHNGMPMLPPTAYVE